MTTATLNSLASFANPLKNLLRLICLLDNSPLPLNSLRNNAVALSTITNANLYSFQLIQF